MIRWRALLPTVCALVALTSIVRLPATAQELAVIRVGTSSDDSARPLLYAVQSGMFKRAGLDVQIDKLANGAAVAAAVSGGSLDVGKGSTLTAVLAHVRGLPFTVIANLANYSAAAPDSALLVPATSTIAEPKDLIGKTIGVGGLSDFNSLMIYAWLAQNGVDAAQLKFLEIPNTAAMGALQQGRIDATLALEPAYASALATKQFRVLAHPLSALGNQFSDTVLFANASWVAAHAADVRAFNRVVHDAAAYVARHEQETKPLAAAFSGFDALTLQTFHPPVRALTLDPADLQPTIDVAAKYKVIPSSFPAREMICDCAISAGAN
jgi:NitT/TauT family transport system substrate-binding protein